MKKAQTEIMGLVVIFILFIFIGIIYLRFSGGEKEDALAPARLNFQGANLVSSLMSYTICPENSFRDALKLCIDGDQQVCGTSSCEAVKSTSEGVLQAAMGEDPYDFVIISDGETLAEAGQRDLKCSEITVNTFNNTLVMNTYIKMRVCRKGSETK